MDLLKEQRVPQSLLHGVDVLLLCFVFSLKTYDSYVEDKRSVNFFL